jgi:WD40 repeat protein
MFAHQRAAILSIVVFAGVIIPALGQTSDSQPTIIEPAHEGRVNALAFSPDGSLLVSSSLFEKGIKPGTVKVWAVKTGKLKQTIPAPAKMRALAAIAFSPDGKQLAIGGGVLYHGDVALYDLQAGKVVWVKMDIASTSSVGVAFAPDGKTLATTGDAGSSKPPVVKLWNVATGELRNSLKGHQHGVGPVAFAPDGKVLATGGWDGEIILWEKQTGQMRGKLQGPKEDKGEPALVRALAFAPDSKQLASATASKVCLWDVDKGKIFRELPNKKGRLLSLAFSPDGKRLAVGNFGEPAVRVWDVQKGAEVQTLDPGKTSAVVAYSPDGTRWAAGLGDGSIRIIPASK